MFVYIALLITFILAALSIRLSFLPRWPARVLALALGGFVYLYGTWLFASVWMRYLFGVLLIATWLVGWLRDRRLQPLQARRPLGNLVLAGILVLLCVLYFIGTTGSPAGVVELRFPLHRGRYCVFQGGRGLPTNVFHVSSRNAIYAIDLVRLNSFGARASKAFSTRLEDYAIFGDTVFAPCAGTISGARDENPDNTPPERKRGPSNLNAVTISTPAAHVFIGHLKQRGVFVQEGDVVQAGDPIGLVGNSGMSIEPHLHIQAHKNSGDGRPWWSEDPILIKFDGDEYRLFEVITPKETVMVPQR